MKAWYITKKWTGITEELLYWNPSCFEAQPDWTREVRRGIRFADEQSTLTVIKNLTLVRAIQLEITINE